MTKIISIIKDRHFVEWKDGEHLLPGVCDYKVVFEQDGELFTGSLSDLDDISGSADDIVDSLVRECVEDIIVSKEQLDKYVDGRKSLTGYGFTSAFAGVLRIMHRGNAHIDDRTHYVLSDIRDTINKLLEQ